MPEISLALDGDLPGFGQRVGMNRLPHVSTIKDWSIAAIEHGMQSGATSLLLAVEVDVDESQTVLVMAETSLNAWMMASAALASAFPDEVSRPGWAFMSPSTRALLVPRFAEAIRRVITADEEKSIELAEMFLDGLGAGAPIEGEPS